MCVAGFEYKHGENPDAVKDVLKGRCDTARTAKNMCKALASQLEQDKKAICAASITIVGTTMHVKVAQELLRESETALTRSIAALNVGVLDKAEESGLSVEGIERVEHEPPALEEQIGETVNKGPDTGATMVVVPRVVPRRKIWNSALSIEVKPTNIALLRAEAAKLRKKM
ncbi:hypothetical protein HDU93_006253 [Gonapodya sp. JEL0774]|nr:hypothetical protein HDU93_006253 [Gonapodya sp. JEL0774]